MLFTPHESFPYIGLRPFSEDDSLYFKGRDEHILQLTSLLESNKFLMVTGASGDGKSSLVYAGLVPNARAGFFKARYTNWVVADFRPERTPLSNLAKTVSRNLKFDNEASVEIELRRGFSSLVELYTSSSLYVDELGQGWKEAGTDGREDMLRKASNLLIVADQFEEFFTNPENYYRNAPSADSQLAINLLLETVRISIERKLPIYIVCTMRSDYIGQCAAFRGLPEFIGFSQFFVPRLKRKEMVQVVKEPAFLHGDRITDRLVERVVYDLGEGIDQLPVLEHAMNEVWIQAGHGKEELDLIHYCMAGGMSSPELPPEDLQRFNAWFESLPPRFREAYQHPGLSQIIDTHANKLYFSAEEKYDQTHAKKITSADAQLIIKVTFTCLTKMDEGRAVRNRMTLQEITDILARPDLGTDVVGNVLNTFREPGNTFLRPYITDEPESHQLKPETVIDITHESLIRNWNLLTLWAKEEFDHLTVYEDFKKQLDRWLTSNKSSGFLLSIGPLTYFESWYDKLNPTAFWINRYLDPGLPPSERMEVSQATIQQSKEFLKKSARKHLVTRVIVRNGATKVVSLLAAILIGVLCLYYYLDARSKENNQVLKRIIAEAEPLLSDPRVIGANKAHFLILSEFRQPGSFKRQLNSIPGPLKVGVARDVYTEIVWQANHSNPPIRKNILFYIDSLLQQPTKNPGGGSKNTKDRTTAMNMLINSSSQYLYFYKDEQVRAVLDRSLASLRELIMEALAQAGSEALPPNLVGDGVEHLLNNHALSDADVRKILENISPFESATGAAQFRKTFPLDARINYSRGNIISHGAGYQQLASLYGMLGQADKTKACLDSLLKYNPSYPNFTNGAWAVASYLFRYHHDAPLKAFVDYYCGLQKIKPTEFYERWLNQSGIYSMDFSNKLWVGENHNISLELFDESQMVRLFDLSERELMNAFRDPDELHYRLSLYFKQRGALMSKLVADGHSKATLAQINSYYSRSVEEYRKVAAGYLKEEVTVFVGGQQQIKTTRRNLFLYPDHLQKVFIRAFFVPLYYSPSFLHYLIDHKLIHEFYKDEQDLGLIYRWLKNYFGSNGTNDTTQEEKNYTELEEKDLVRIDSLITHFSAKDKLHGMGNLSKLMLIHRYREQGQFDKIELAYQGLDIDKFDSNLKEREFNTGGLRTLINSFSVYMSETAQYLASQGRSEEANRIISEYTNSNNRIKAYSDVTRGFRVFPSTVPADIYAYLDSAATETDRLEDYLFVSTDPRIIVSYAISSLGGKNFYDLSQSYVKQLSLNAQTDIVQRWIQGIAESGDYYQAHQSIPEITILTDRLYLYNIILLEDAYRRADNADWKLWLHKRREANYQEDYGFEATLF